MDAEKILGIFEKQNVKLAKAVVPNTIGDTVLAMHQSGCELSWETLISQLLQQRDQHNQNHLSWHQYGAALALLQSDPLQTDATQAIDNPNQ